MDNKMSFKKSGLPQTENIEKAYNYALEAHIRRFDYEIQTAYKSADDQIKQHLEMMEQTGHYTDKKMKDLHREQKKALNTYKAQVRKQLVESRDVDFRIRVIEPAVVLSNSDKRNEEAINAALLLESIRSSNDFEMIQAEFGEETSGIIHCILDMEAHPSEQAGKLKFLSDNTKRVNLALLIGNLKSFIDIGKQLPEGQQLALATGIEGAKKQAEFASAVRGLDKKLDDIFVTTFNEAGKYLDTGFLVVVDKKTNNLKMIPRKVVRPPSNDGFKNNGL